MNSPNAMIREESRPAGDTLTLTKETASGFVDRANRFQPDSDGAFLADRWRSGFFNVRSDRQESDATAEAGGRFPQASPDAGAAREADAGHFTVRTERVRGFVDRGGRFVGAGKGITLGDYLVSDWFNVRRSKADAAPH
jgi:hypothetical protein